MNSNQDELSDVNKLTDKYAQLKINDTETKNKRQGRTGKRNGHKRNSNNEVGRVSFKSFNYSNAQARIQPNIFTRSKGVAIYANGCITDITDRDSSHIIASNLPLLADDISELADKTLLQAKKLKIPYLGYNLYADVEKFGPMDQTLLDSPIPCFEYLKSMKTVEEERSDKRTGITIITPRHHITELMMTVYEDNSPSFTGKSWLYTVLKNGLIVISEDLYKGTNTNKPKSKAMSSFSKKVIYSGFAFEELVVKNSDEYSKPYFYISENELAPDIKLLIRSEMDSYNPKTNTFTELKCFNKVHLGVQQHRKKLLKTWIQTGLTPNCDILLGVRDTSSGLLDDLVWYSRNALYQELNNQNLPSFKKNLNFKASISINWLKHCLRSIQTIIQNDTEKNYTETTTYKVIVDRHKSLIVNRLGSVPKNVQIPKDFTD